MLHSGKFGVVDGVSSVRNWSINDTHTPATFVASNTQLGTGRKAGVQDWTGSYSAYGGTPAHMPGESFTFAGYGAPDNDISGSSSYVYDGTAVVESVVINWNWSNGEIINHTVNFGGHLALTTSTDTHADSTDPDVPAVCGTKIEIDDATNYEIPNLVSASLTISSALQTYTNSSTIVGGACWTGRKSGIIDAQVSLTQQDIERGENESPAKGTDVKLLMYIDGSTFWDISWMHVVDYTGLNVDIETGAIIQRTINLALNVWDGSTIGAIVQPDLTSWWP